MNFLVPVFLIAFFLLNARSGFSAPSQSDCEALATYVADLTDEAFGKAITLVSATWHPADGSMPEYCEVKGRIFPETDFAVRLPTAWEGRLVHFGGGAWDGVLGGADRTSLNLGFAGSASNGGHNGSPLSGAFGLKDPYYRQFIPPYDTDNPYACQKIVDFGNRAHRETPLVAKKIIKEYYGSDAHHTYYSGTSTGGREGMVEAQMNYDLFDGIYIGAPGGGHVAVTFRGLWDSVQGASLLPVFSNKAIALHDAVYGICDGIDGLEDGLIDDPRKCDFDPLIDLPPCPDDIDAPGCFTLAQRQALKEIYRGPHNSSGQLYVGTPLSAEYLTDPTNPNSSGFRSALSDILMPDMYRYWVFDPPPGPTWDMMTFNWETDPEVVKASTCSQCIDGDCNTYSLTAELDAVELSPSAAPNMGGLEPFKAKGGKMIHYHGWADALVSAFTSTHFYETVLSQMGVAETKGFYKLYMAPGLGHVAGGIGYLHTWTDAMTALVNWVENNEEPGALIGTRGAISAWDWPAMSRPLCPYPEVARYNGTGDMWDAGSFMCVPPIEVRIEPETLNLKSKGVFTAFITVPEGYSLADWNIGNLSCEGAAAVKGNFSGTTYIAKFNRQDLRGVTPGDEVTLTVKGTFEVDGQTALIQAGDTIRVIKNAPQKGKK